MKAFYIVPALLATLLLVSCAKEDDAAPTDDREKFIASWTCSEHSSINGNNPPFTVNIKAGSGTDDVLIENFYGAGFQEKATAYITVNDIDIFSQTYAGYTIKGNGSLSGNIITMNYTVNDAGTIDTVSATFTKQ